MKHLIKFNEQVNINNIIDNLKDILLELEDLKFIIDFSESYEYDVDPDNYHISIMIKQQPTKTFRIVGEVKETLERIRDYIKMETGLDTVTFQLRDFRKQRNTHIDLDTKVIGYTTHVLVRIRIEKATIL